MRLKRRHDQNATAYHEAGHAVIATLLGLRLRYVEIQRQRYVAADEVLGVCYFEDDLERLTPPFAQDQVVRMVDMITAMLAGTIAEQMLTGTDHVQPDWADLEKAGRLADMLSDNDLQPGRHLPVQAANASYTAERDAYHSLADAYMTFLKTRARSLLSLPAIRAALDRVATRLVEHGRVSGAEVGALLEDAAPPPA